MNSCSVNKTESVNAVPWNSYGIPHTATHFKFQLFQICMAQKCNNQQHLWNTGTFWRPMKAADKANELLIT
jgi:hypothetical protein